MVQELEEPEDTAQVLVVPVSTLTSTLEVVPEATGQPLEVPVELEEPEDLCSTVFPSHQVVFIVLHFLPVAALLSLDLLSDLTPTTPQLYLSAVEVP